MTDHLTASTLTVTVERTSAAPVRAVFDAWTDPEVMCRWWHPEAAGSTVHAASDLRVGGELRVEMGLADGGRAGPAAAAEHEDGWRGALENLAAKVGL